MRMMMIAAALLALAGCDQAPEAEQATNATAAPDARIGSPVTLTAADGVKVFGQWYPAANPKAVILLFHQAGSSKDEYATIAPRLVGLGYSALAIDQRSGGSMFGKNETVAALTAKGVSLPDGKAGYLPVEADMEAALAWAKTKKLPVVLWGSSYSAALAVDLAAKHPEVHALLLFSPGEYLPDPHFVEHAAAGVMVPVFVTTSGSSEEIAAAQPIIGAIGEEHRFVSFPKEGVHGSSTLIYARNPKTAADNWGPVQSFLRDEAS